MQQDIFEVKRERFNLLKDNEYILQGNFPREYDVEAWLDNQKIEATKEFWENNSALERFVDLEAKGGEKVTVRVNLPEDLSHKRMLRIYAVTPGRRFKWFCIPVKDLLKRRGKPMYYIEYENVNPAIHQLQVRGWVTFREPVETKVYDQNGKEIPCNIQWCNRMDVVTMFKEFEIEPKCGFSLELNHVETDLVYLVFRTNDTKAIYPIHMTKAMIFKKKIETYATKSKYYFRNYGFVALMKKISGKMQPTNSVTMDYPTWISRHLPTKAELAQQRETTFENSPRISIVVPLYKTPLIYLQKLIDCIKAQTYSNWELCFSDGSGADSPLTEFLNKVVAEDNRIKVITHDEPLQIAENTNAAISIATGDWVAFADHDDEITPDAFYHCVKAINEKPQIKVIYSDEDKTNMDGTEFFEHFMKPDFNIDLLCSENYICHLFVVNRSVIDQVGMLRKEFDGAQDYDFVFRCVEAVKENEIYHIPRILYHWRSHEDSTAGNQDSKLYAFEAGTRAIQAHYDRIGVPAKVEQGEYLGIYRTKFLWEEKPLISIIIPNKDHIEDLKRCMDSIDEKSTYRNYEYIIIENNSELKATFDYYDELEKNNDNVHVVYWDGVFNYSQINNFGVKAANGDYLLLLNNDTEIINKDCLEELLGYCMRDDVGAVGARLYYGDDTIQHAGVVIGFGGIAGHCFVLQQRGYPGYGSRIICAQDYSAVTAACMMVKKKAFEEVGGLSEDLAVAFNDIDFCLKLRRAGYLIVYNPYAELYHYESKSRGLEDTPEKIARFNREIAIFEKKWPDILRYGDPYYSPNLTLATQDFSLKPINRR